MQSCGPSLSAPFYLLLGEPRPCRHTAHGCAFLSCTTGMEMFVWVFIFDVTVSIFYTENGKKGSLDYLTNLYNLPNFLIYTQFCLLWILCNQNTMQWGTHTGTTDGQPPIQSNSNLASITLNLSLFLTALSLMTSLLVMIWLDRHCSHTWNSKVFMSKKFISQPMSWTNNYIFQELNASSCKYQEYLTGNFITR